MESANNASASTMNTADSNQNEESQETACGEKEMPSSSGAIEKNKKYFTVKKWSASALWAWDIAVDCCPICRNSIMDLCIECQAKERPSMADQCQVAWGICNHAFHLHCILRWLKSRFVCPLDNRDWVFHKVSQ